MDPSSDRGDAVRAPGRGRAAARCGHARVAAARGPRALDCGGAPGGRRIPLVRLRLVCLLLIAAGLAACAGPDSLVRRRAYLGGPLTSQQQATLFAVWDGGDGNLTYLCELDGRSFRRNGYANPCPSVLYVLPGEHRVGVENHRGGRVAVAVIGLTAQPARTYEISVVSNPDRAEFYVREMDPGFALTYRDVAPTFFKGNRVNIPVDP